LDILSIKNLTQTMSMGDATVKTTDEINTDASNSFFSLFSSFSMSSVSAVAGAAKDDSLQNTSLAVEGKGYEKLNFKTSDKSDTAVKTEVNAENKETVENYKKEVVSKISEATGMDEETVEQAMEELALTIMDLLNPQNLAQLVETLTGSDTASLLLSSDFTNLMDEITALTENLATELNVETSDLMEVLADFDFEVSDEAEFVVSEAADFEEVPQNLSTDMFSGMTTTQTGENQNSVEIGYENENAEIEVPVETVVQKEVVVSDENKNKNFEMSSQESEINVEVKDVRSENDFTKNSKNSDHSSEHLFAQNNAEVPVNTQNVDAPVADVTSFANSYTTIDPLELLEQVTSNLKITLASDATTMEMQLNPENLGKVFLQLSSKEGVVSAHFNAQNEVVKEVLESQMADLRTSLNQQGVKVDAIEVTVSSHGFERNLDENQHREEKEGEMMEENKKSRRSLRMDSLDELQGLMTEEEMLVAQIMRDNGNSMDLTA